MHCQPLTQPSQNGVCTEERIKICQVVHGGGGFEDRNGEWTILRVVVVSEEALCMLHVQPISMTNSNNLGVDFLPQIVVQQRHVAVT